MHYICKHSDIAISKGQEFNLILPHRVQKIFSIVVSNSANWCYCGTLYYSSVSYLNGFHYYLQMRQEHLFEFYGFRASLYPKEGFTLTGF